MISCKVVIKNQFISSNAYVFTASSLIFIQFDSFVEIGFLTLYGKIMLKLKNVLKQ